MLILDDTIGKMSAYMCAWDWACEGTCSVAGFVCVCVYVSVKLWTVPVSM